ncbi:hypothetical protein BDB01DRAFT_304816 [Pilobolus umbonatus]|nr:hypothetical protein BDB01DRAFT_304816 [Pilobolus umbonatus]
MGSILPDAVHSSNFSNNNRTSQSIHHRLNNEEDTYIDSDEEVKSVMQVFQMSQPRPLAERPFYYMKRRRQCYRLKDILYNVLTPKDDTMGDIPPTPIRQPLYHHQGTNHTTAKNLTGNSTMTDIFCEPNSPSSIHTSFSVR